VSRLRKVIAVKTKPPAPRLFTWLARRAGLDGNPLRRPADRAQSWLKLLGFLLLVVAGPLTAVSAGQAAYRAGVAEARAQLSGLHRSPAVLLPAAPATAGASGEFGSGQTWMRARWHAADGAVRTSPILAPAGTRAGATVTVWLTAAGRISPGPLQKGQITGRAITTAVLTAAVFTVAVLAGLWLVQWRLDRRRLAAWDAAWQRVEPRWSRRGPSPAP